MRFRPAAAASRAFATNSSALAVMQISTFQPRRCGKFAQFMNNGCGAAAPGDRVHEKQIGYGGNRGRGKFHKLAMLTEPRPTVNLRLFELL